MRDPDPPVSQRLPRGARLAQYEVVRPAGEGGMGVVYLARDTDLDRPVAIKVLRPAAVADAAPEGLTGAAGDDPTVLAPAAPEARFLREARSAARLNHPNVAAVYHVGRAGGVTFIAMEWVDGHSLAEHLRASVFLDWREATTAARDAAAGLAEAHRAGVVHRDVKPANLMRTPAGAVKVVDFGLARLHDAPADLTRAGTVLGTPTYLSPEQCRGERATAASDVYALGCTLYHLLTSRPPYAADDVAGLIYQHLAEPFPDARRLTDDVPAAVLAVLARATRKDPADRYPDAAAMHADLDAALAGDGRPAPPPAADPPAAEPAVDAPNNLPHPATSFVGRTRELAAVRAMLQDHRLVTLLGPGGTGKTRLSLRVATGEFGRHPDGVWFVDLAGIDSAQAVVPSIAAATGARAGGRQDLAAALVEHLRPLRALVVLDNCEHVIAAAAEAAAAVLAGCPGVRVLATSRSALACPGEAEFRVPPLSSPVAGQAVPLDELRQMDAVRLFADRAALVRPSFAVTDTTAADVASICRRLDGIPLAVELAAARLKSLSPRQIAERLDDALALLTTGPRTAQPRQRTLRALIDWSHELLDARERVALARLSVFAGSCSLEAAEAVLPGGDIAGDDVLDLLAALVDKSLLVVEDRGGAVRYRQLEMIRHYAAERLDAAGDRAAVEAKHLAHYAAAAEAAHPRLYGPDQSAVVAALDADHDNIRAALDRGGGSADAQRLVAALSRYWLHCGNVVEGLARVRAVNRAAAVDAPTRFTSAALITAGILAYNRGEWAESRADSERALALARQFADPAAEARALSNLGTLAKDQGDLPRARACAEAALAIRRREADPAGLAAAVNNLANILQKLPGEEDAARSMYEESRALHARLGDATWVAYTDLNLGHLEAQLGRSGPSRARYAAALAGLEAAGDAWGRAYALAGLGDCDLLDGDGPAARRRLTEAAAACRGFGDLPGLSEQLDSLARADLLDGDPVAALAHATEAVRLKREVGDDPGVAVSLETLAAVTAAADPARAAALLGAAGAVRAGGQQALFGARLADRDATREAVRRSLGADVFAAAFAAGAAATLDDLLRPAR